MNEIKKEGRNCTYVQIVEKKIYKWYQGRFSRVLHQNGAITRAPSLLLCPSLFQMELKKTHKYRHTFYTDEMIKVEFEAQNQTFEECLKLPSQQ